MYFVVIHCGSTGAVQCWSRSHQHGKDIFCLYLLVPCSFYRFCWIFCECVSHLLHRRRWTTIKSAVPQMDARVNTGLIRCGNCTTNRIFQPVGNTGKHGRILQCTFCLFSVRLCGDSAITSGQVFGISAGRRSWDHHNAFAFNLKIFWHSELRTRNINSNQQRYKRLFISGHVVFDRLLDMFFVLSFLCYCSLSSMENIHDCWQVPVCGLCFSQLSPWKPQMVELEWQWLIL